MAKSKSKKISVAFESDMWHAPDWKIARGRQSGREQAGRSSAGRGKLGEFIAIATVPLVLVLGNSMLIPVLPQMQSALNISQFQTSLVITLFSVTAAVFIPVVGYLSDHFSRKAIIIPCLIIYGGAGVLAGFGAIWESYGVLIAARALQGIGAAGTAPIAMALVGDMYNGGTESKALGLTEASNGTGKVLSPIIGSVLALIVWYAVFFAFPAFCLLSLLAVVFLIREPKRNSEPPALKQYLKKIGNILRAKGRWLVSSFVAGSLALFVLFGVLFYLSDILEKDPYHIDGVVKGLVLAIPLMAMVTTSYITGSVIKKNGVLIRRLMIAGLALSTAAYVLTIFFSRNIYVFVGLLTAGSVGTGLLLPCLNTMITGSVSKGERGMITSLYSSLRFFGVAFGPPIFSWLMGWSKTNDNAVFITVSVLSALSLLLAFFLIKPDKRLPSG